MAAGWFFLHIIVLQENGMAAGSASGYRAGISLFFHGHAVSTGIPLPSPAQGDSAPEKPEKEGEREKDSRANTEATIPRLFAISLIYR